MSFSIDEEQTQTKNLKNQKEKHKQFKYFNYKEDKSKVSVSEFCLKEDDFILEEKQEKVSTDKEKTFNILLSKITIGEVI